MPVMMGMTRKRELPLPHSVVKQLHAVATMAAADFRKRGGRCRTEHVERDLTRLYRTMQRQGRAPRYVALLGFTWDLRLKRKCDAIPV
jgi:hypothetical protein